MQLIDGIRDRMDAFAERMAAFQTKLFMTVFYYTAVPAAHAWLRLRGRLHHRNTGYFAAAGDKPRTLDAARKQF